MRYSSRKVALRSGVAAIALLATTAAHAQVKVFDVPSEDAVKAIPEFARQAGIEILVPADQLKGIKTPALKGSLELHTALSELLAGTGISIVSDDGQTIALSAPPKNAEAASNEEAAIVPGLETVVVTGSHIRGGVTASSSIVLNRKAIEETGYSTIDQVTQSLPENFGGGAQRGTLLGDGSDESVNNLANGSAVNLRGLGSHATLVLLDGHRLPGSSASEIQDISMIPLNVVDRIDVVPDGASAVYGADAVAGVVNIVTRQDLDGVLLQARYGAATEGGYDEKGASMAAGTTFSNGSVVASYDYLDQSQLLASDRTYSQGATVAGPTDLLPHDISQSLFLKGNLQVTPDLKLYASAYGTTRQDDNLDSIFGTTTLYRYQVLANQFNVSGGAQYQFLGTWLAELYAGVSQNHVKSLGSAHGNSDTSTFNHGQADLQASADGALLSLPGGDVRLAVGDEYRSENISESDVKEPALNARASRSVESVYAELLIPLVGADNARPGVQSLQLTIAGRYDDYSDFGSTFNPKYGLVWNPVADLKMRGTYGTSYRAPTFQELVTEYELDALLYLPNPNVPAGQTLTLLRAFGSNADLKPETARTWSAGGDFTPSELPGLNLSATWFNVNFSNRIERVITNIVATYTDPAYTPLIDTSPDPALLAMLVARPFTGNSGFYSYTGAPFTLADIQALVDDRYQNVAVSHVDGLDLSTSYTHEFDFGQVQAELNATWLANDTFQLTRDAATSDVLNTVDHPVDFKLRAAMGWQGQSFGINGALNFVDGYTNDTVAPTIPIASWTTVDLRLTYNPGADVLRGAFESSQLALSISNLFDAHPPFVSSPANFATPIGYDPTNASPIGRLISVEWHAKL
jgi:outer membrane receptor for ferrienterochelin and colicin